MADEGHLVRAGRVEQHLVVTGTQIERGEPACSTHRVEAFIDPRKRVRVFLCSFI